jgi:hypothetical protein
LRRDGVLELECAHARKRSWRNGTRQCASQSRAIFIRLPVKNQRAVQFQVAGDPPDAHLDHPVRNQQRIFIHQ